MSQIEDSDAHSRVKIAAESESEGFRALYLLYKKEVCTLRLQAHFEGYKRALKFF